MGVAPDVDVDLIDNQADALCSAHVAEILSYGCLSGDARE